MCNVKDFVIPPPKKRLKKDPGSTKGNKVTPGKREKTLNTLFEPVGVDSRVGNGMNRSGTDDQPYGDLPYLKKPFLEFMRFIARVFYDDECIVLLEFLGSQERAYTESDIREATKWRDSLLHGKLLFLEAQLILQRYQATDKGVRSPVYWRISPYVARAVKYHCDTYLEKLQSEVSAKESIAEFCCPSCGLNVDALDIMSGPRRVADEHPICPACPNEVLLITSNYDNERSQARQQLNRAQSQLWPIYQGLQNVISMNIPEFTPFTRADKNDVTAQAKALQSFQEREVKERIANSKNKQSFAVNKQAEALRIGIVAGDNQKKSTPAATSRLIPWFQSQRKVTTGQETSTSHDTINDDASTVLSKKRSTVSFSFNRYKSAAISVSDTVVAEAEEPKEEAPTFDALLGHQSEEVTPEVVASEDVKIYISKRKLEYKLQEIMDDPDLENDMNDTEYEKYIYLQEEQQTT